MASVSSSGAPFDTANLYIPFRVVFERVGTLQTRALSVVAGLNGEDVLAWDGSTLNPWYVGNGLGELDIWAHASVYFAFAGVFWSFENGSSRQLTSSQRIFKWLLNDVVELACSAS